jgi:chromate reductase, NAD(P)H dehydrogenase (quinone)
MCAIRILGISGSLRRESHNTRLLRAAARKLPPGVELELFGGLAEVPLYNEDEDVDPAPRGAQRLRRAIVESDGLLISTPEYNGSAPGVLKNAIDWASRPFPNNVLKGKPVAVVGASTGLFGAVWAQADTRKALTIAGADVVDRELPIGQAHVVLTADAEVSEPGLEATLGELVAVLAARAGSVTELPAVADRAA